MATSLDEQLAGLEALSIGELRGRWAKLTGRVVPLVSPSMLRLALAYEIQSEALGGLSRATQQRLDQLVRAKTVTKSIQPGMRLVREWQGKLHVVTIGKDNVIRWDGREWTSLSEVARTITGTRWSGPAFFGLKQKSSAA